MKTGSGLQKRQVIKWTPSASGGDMQSSTVFIPQNMPQLLQRIFLRRRLVVSTSEYKI